MVTIRIVRWCNSADSAAPKMRVFLTTTLHKRLLLNKEQLWCCTSHTGWDRVWSLRLQRMRVCAYACVCGGGERERERKYDTIYNSWLSHLAIHVHVQKIMLVMSCSKISDHRDSFFISGLPPKQVLDMYQESTTPTNYGPTSNWNTRNWITMKWWLSSHLLSLGYLYRICERNSTDNDRGVSGDHFLIICVLWRRQNHTKRWKSPQKTRQHSVLYT